MSNRLAVCGRVFPAAVDGMLTRYCIARRLDSRAWLTTAQANDLFGTGLKKTTPQYQRCGIEVALPDLVDAQLTPVWDLDPPKARTLLNEAPLPPQVSAFPGANNNNNNNVLSHKLLVLDPAGATWRPVPLEQRTWASLFTGRPSQGSGRNNSNAKFGHRSLFVNERWAHAPPFLQTMTVFNAQEFANPVAIDPALFHRDALTGSPIDDPHICSGLATVAMQCGFVSVRWVAASDAVHTYVAKPVAGGPRNVQVRLPTGETLLPDAGDSHCVLTTDNGALVNMSMIEWIPQCGRAGGRTRGGSAGSKFVIPNHITVRAEAGKHFVQLPFVSWRSLSGTPAQADTPEFGQAQAPGATWCHRLWVRERDLPFWGLRLRSGARPVPWKDLQVPRRYYNVEQFSTPVGSFSTDGTAANVDSGTCAHTQAVCVGN